MSETEHAPELDVTHARQARRGRHAFVILVCSTLLVVIAFAAIYAFNSGGFSRVNNPRVAERTAPATPEPRPTSGG